MDPVNYDLLVVMVLKEGGKPIGLTLDKAPMTNIPFISAIEPNSAAAKSGLQVNDILIAINRKRVLNVTEFTSAVHRSILSENRIVIARQRETSLKLEFLHPPNGPRLSNCDYYLFRVDQSNGGPTIGLTLGMVKDRLEIVGVGPGCGLAAGFKVNDRPLVIGTKIISTATDFDTELETAGGEPVDVLVERQRGDRPGTEPVRIPNQSKEAGTSQQNVYLEDATIEIR